MQHATAEVEILIDHQHTGPAINRANGRSQARAPAPRDDDVHLIVPDDLPGATRGDLRLRFSRLEESRGSQSGGDPCFDEIAAVQRILVLERRVLRRTVVFRCHL